MPRRGKIVWVTLIDGPAQGETVMRSGIPAGQRRFVHGIRFPDGQQFSDRHEYELQEGDTTAKWVRSLGVAPISMGTSTAQFMPPAPPVP